MLDGEKLVFSRMTDLDRNYYRRGYFDDEQCNEVPLEPAH